MDSPPQIITAILRFISTRSRDGTENRNRILAKLPHSVVESKLLAQFPGSSTVEHSAVTRRVASSNLARGAKPFVFANLDETPLAQTLPFEAWSGGRLLPSGRTARLPIAHVESGR